MTEPQPKAADDTEISRAFRRLQKTAEEKWAREAAEGRSEPPALPANPAKVVQLPLWPEPVRGAPNSFLRSALFAAIQGKGRKQMKRQLLGSMQDVTVRFTGQQLDQSDSMFGSRPFTSLAFTLSAIPATLPATLFLKL